MKRATSQNDKLETPYFCLNANRR